MSKESTADNGTYYHFTTEATLRLNLQKYEKKVIWIAVASFLFLSPTLIY